MLASQGLVSSLVRVQWSPKSWAPPYDVKVLLAKECDDREEDGAKAEVGDGGWP